MWCLLMALFSIYCGLIYNEVFGLPIAIWDTTYTRFEKPSGGKGASGSHRWRPGSPAPRPRR